MALTRKMLRAMGIEDEKIEQIVEAHTETVDALKEELSKAKAASDELDAVKKELESAKADLDSAKKDSWKVKYDAIKEDFEEFKKTQTAKDQRNAKEKAYEALLKKAGVAEKRIPAIMRIVDLEEMGLDEEGNLADADKLTASIKEEWSDFITSKDTKGADVSKPPASQGKAGSMTREEIMAIKDTTQRQKAIAENHELFGI
jgi:hypothetical protein